MLKNINEDSPFYLAMSSVGLRLAKALATSFDPINIKSILSKSNTYNSLVESTREQLKHVNEIILDGRDVTLNVFLAIFLFVYILLQHLILVKWLAFGK